MTKVLPINDKIFTTENFNVRSLEDEIVVDQLCVRFLRTFFQHLVENNKTPPEEAGRLARGADHFLREFIIPEMQENIFAISGQRIRQFAGNWYIVKTLEPNSKELGDILDGIKSFYLFCSQIGKIHLPLYEDIAWNCEQLEYFQQRIDSFWEIEDDGYFSWESECSLRK